MPLPLLGFVPAAIGTLARAAVPKLGQALSNPIVQQSAMGAASQFLESRSSSGPVTALRARLPHAESGSGSSSGHHHHGLLSTVLDVASLVPGPIGLGARGVRIAEDVVDAVKSPFGD